MTTPRRAPRTRAARGRRADMRGLAPAPAGKRWRELSLPASRLTSELPLSAVPRETPFVASEVAPLRRVLVHRPGRELSRLSPDNIAGLLFDDVPWFEAARAEHDAFCRLLRERGAEVCYLSDLLEDLLG